MGRVGDLAGEVGERRVASDGEHEPAPLIGTIGVNDRRVGGQPIERGACIGNALAVGARPHSVDESAAETRAFDASNSTRQKVSRRRQKARLLAGSAQNCARKPFSAGARHISADDEAAHRMPEQEIRNRLAEPSLHHVPQCVDVGD